MKLAEFLQNLFETTGVNKSINNTYEDYVLTPQMLRIPQIKEQLLKCEEFKNTKEIIVLDEPSIKFEDKESPTPAVTTKLYERIKFKEKVYIYSILLTPAVLDIEDFKSPVKDNVCITPVYHDLESFTPKRTISVFVNPELFQDAVVTKDNEYKEKLIQDFKKALDNPDEYLSKGKRGVMVRCVFEESIEKFNREELDYYKPMSVKI